MTEEGWYIDPYGRHEARWISEGTPTALVRDGGVESQDPPPDQPVTVEMEPWRAGDVHDASAVADTGLCRTSWIASST